jgi:hypothetical protein
LCRSIEARLASGDRPPLCVRPDAEASALVTPSIFNISRRQGEFKIDEGELWQRQKRCLLPFRATAPDHRGTADETENELRTTFEIAKICVSVAISVDLERYWRRAGHCVGSDPLPSRDRQSLAHPASMSLLDQMEKLFLHTEHRVVSAYAVRDQIAPFARCLRTAPPRSANTHFCSLWRSPCRP